MRLVAAIAAPHNHALVGEASLCSAAMHHVLLPHSRFESVPLRAAMHPSDQTELTACWCIASINPSEALLLPHANVALAVVTRTANELQAVGHADARDHVVVAIALCSTRIPPSPALSVALSRDACRIVVGVHRVSLVAVSSPAHPAPHHQSCNGCTQDTLTNTDLEPFGFSPQFVTPHLSTVLERWPYHRLPQ